MYFAINYWTIQNVVGKKGDQSAERRHQTNQRKNNSIIKYIKKFRIDVQTGLDPNVGYENLIGPGTKSSSESGWVG